MCTLCTQILHPKSLRHTQKRHIFQWRNRSAAARWKKVGLHGWGSTALPNFLSTNNQMDHKTKFRLIQCLPLKRPSKIHSFLAVLLELLLLVPASQLLLEWPICFQEPAKLHIIEVAFISVVAGVTRNIFLADRSSAGVCFKVKKFLNSSEVMSAKAVTPSL